MVYATIAVNSMQFEVMLIAVGEFADEKLAQAKGDANIKLERPLSHAEYTLRTWCLEKDANVSREEMRLWFVSFGMSLKNAEKWVQSCGRAIAKTLGIPTREELDDRQKQVDGGDCPPPTGE